MRQGALLDLVDVFAQKLNEYPGATFVMLVRAFLGRVRDPLPAALADELQRILVERIRGTGYVTTNDAALASIANEIRGRYRIYGPGRTVLVPHSQGSLYANSAYALLTQAANSPVPAKSLAIVAVASPAAYVAGTNGRHVNSRQDLVLYGLRKLLGNASVLRGNVTQPLTLDDPLGHGFQAIYLRPGTPARTKLLADIAALFDALVGLEYEGLGPNFWPGVQAAVTWYPAAPATPPICEFPARLTWLDMWSDPNRWRTEWRYGVEVTELERQARVNATARYESGLRLWRDYVLNNSGTPADADAHSAWRVYSADSQWTYYWEYPPSPPQGSDVQCLNDPGRWVRIDTGGSIRGHAHLLGRCGK